MKNITKNTRLIFTLLLFAFLLNSCSKAKKTKIITIDTHDDINVMNFTDSLNYTMDTDTQVNLPKMKAGGLDVAWFVVYTGQGSLDEEGYAAAEDNAIDKFDAIDRLVNQYAPDQIELALTSDDVRRIHAKGKKVAMIGLKMHILWGLTLQMLENTGKEEQDMCPLRTMVIANSLILILENLMGLLYTVV